MYIAEMSCNHNGDYRVMSTMIDAAKASGATVVKIQLFEPWEMTHKRYSDRYLITDGPWKGKFLWDLYCEIRTPKAWLPMVQERCEELGLGLMVSCFSPETVEFCEEHGVQMYKIASPEVGYKALIDACADKPTFVSTGLASVEDLNYVCETIPSVVLMHCVSSYPADLDSCNLRTILALRDRGPVGLSDHTTTIVAPVVATVLGAVAIEKHFKITNDCPDSDFSVFPDQFKTMVETCEAAKASLGNICLSGVGRYKRQEVDGKMVRVVK